MRMIESRRLIIHPLEVDVPCIDEDAQNLVDCSLEKQNLWFKLGHDAGEYTTVSLTGNCSKYKGRVFHHFFR